VNERELADRLQWKKAAEVDLLSVLQSHFGSAQSSDERVVEYVKDGVVALTLRTDSRFRPRSLEPGPGLATEDVEALAASLTNTRKVSSTRVLRRVLYSTVPVDGYWTYDGPLGAFTLRPVPPGAPTVDTLVGDHPLVLEFEVALCGESFVDSSRIERTYRNLAWLLAGLVRHVHVPTLFLRKEWVLLSQEDDPASLYTRYGQVGYWAPGDADTAIPGVGSRFLSTDGLPPIVETPWDEYSVRRGIRTDDPMDLPANLRDSLDHVARVDDETRQQVLRACFWLEHAHRTWGYSHSASFAAYAQAIEAMLPPAKSETCGTCMVAHDTPSLTSRFDEWVRSFVPDSDASKDLYVLRSKLVHGQVLLSTDIDLLMGMSPRANSERARHDRVSIAARVGFTNWLTDRS